ncbi:hypothetical protein ACHAXR_000748 [Thalassiosira sp. AJA248-18]
MLTMGPIFTMKIASHVVWVGNYYAVTNATLFTTLVATARRWIAFLFSPGHAHFV